MNVMNEELGQENVPLGGEQCDTNMGEGTTIEDQESELLKVSTPLEPPVIDAASEVTEKPADEMISTDDCVMEAQPKKEEIFESEQAQEVKEDISVLQQTATQDAVESSHMSPTTEDSTKPPQRNPFLDAIDRALHNDPISYSSDEEDNPVNAEMSPTVATAETSSSSESEAGNGSQSDASDGSDSDDSSSSNDDSDIEDVAEDPNPENSRKRANRDDMDLSDDENSGPVKSKHEILDEPAPQLPDDLKITDQTPLELVGTILRVTGKTLIVEAAVSGEFRVLEEKSVFCLEDRTPIGVLYETFGRVQAPLYTVKFSTDEAAELYKSKIGQKVFYVVSASKFLFTDTIKSLKGSDASNLHDEEIPTEEQEFSDDEMERLNNMKKKKKKAKPAEDNADNQRSGSSFQNNQNPRNKGRKNQQNGPQNSSNQYRQGPSNQAFRPQQYHPQPFYNNGGGNPMFMNQQYPMQFPQQQWNPMQGMMPPAMQQQQFQQQFQMMQQFMNHQQQYQQYGMPPPQQQQPYPQQSNSQMYNGGPGPGPGPDPSSGREGPRSYDSSELNYDEK